MMSEFLLHCSSSVFDMPKCIVWIAALFSYQDAWPLPAVLLNSLSNQLSVDLETKTQLCSVQHSSNAKKEEGRRGKMKAGKGAGQISEEACRDRAVLTEGTEKYLLGKDRKKWS